MRLLAIDIGNTSIKIALFYENSIQDIRENLSDLELINYLNSKKIDKFIVSSVIKIQN